MNKNANQLGWWWWGNTKETPHNCMSMWNKKRRIRIKIKIKIKLIRNDTKLISTYWIKRTGQNRKEKEICKRGSRSTAVTISYALPQLRAALYYTLEKLHAFIQYTYHLTSLHILLSQYLFAKWNKKKIFDKALTWNGIWIGSLRALVLVHKKVKIKTFLLFFYKSLSSSQAQFLTYAKPQVWNSKPYGYQIRSMILI